MKPHHSMLAVLYLFAWLLQVHAQPPQRPNVIFILADDIGFDALGVNGNQSFFTPHLDSMARNGINFTRCESSPLCSPSRLMLLTGRQNFRNYSNWGLLGDTVKTLGNLMRNAGYSTAYYGKLQLALENDNARMSKWGWDTFTIFEVPGDTLNEYRYKSPTLIDNNGLVPDSVKRDKYCDDILTQRMSQFIDSNVQKPFFIYYSMSLCHSPFSPTPDDPQFAAWDPYGNKSDTSYFASMVKYMDKKVGQVLNKLKSAGLDSNTVVFFAGDNGTPGEIFYYVGGKRVAGQKGNTSEGGTRVPLIAYLPGRIHAGRTNDDLIDFSDFFPTLADCARGRVFKKVAASVSTQQTDGWSLYNRLFPQADTVVHDTLYTDTTLMYTTQKDTVIIDTQRVDSSRVDTIRRDSTMDVVVYKDSTVFRGVSTDTLRFADSVRSFLFAHYAPIFHNLKDTLRRWVRNKEYKLYDSTTTRIDGKFFNIVKDPKETKPLSDAKLTTAERALKTSFKRIIDSMPDFSMPPVLKDVKVTNIDHRSATLFANLVDPRLTALLERGSNLRVGNIPAYYFNNNLRHPVVAVDTFSQIRSSLAAQTRYQFSVYGRNRNENRSIGYVWGAFFTLSSPPTKQASAFAATSAACSVKLTWKAATFPVNGATKAGYLIITSPDSIIFNNNINGKKPDLITSRPQNRITKVETKLPTKPGVNITINNLSPDTLYHFALVPYTWNGTKDSTYNYRTDSVQYIKSTPLSCGAALRIANEEITADPSPLITIAPNPSSNYFTLMLDKALLHLPAAIVVSDAAGRILLQKPVVGTGNFRFGEQLTPGIYFVQCTIADQSFKFSVIKQ